MKHLFVLILVTVIGFTARAQDKIYTISNKVIECKVIEVGTEEIKYKLTEDPDAATISIKVMDVVKIVFADGKVMEFKDDLENPDLYLNNNKNAWKVNFFSPLLTNLGLTYERSIRPGFSLEGGLGIIGIGQDPTDLKPRGAYLSFGPRFLNTPDYKSGSTRYYHVLKGAYIQPQILFGIYGYNQRYSTFNAGTWVTTETTAREITTYGAVMIVFGKQNVYANRFLIDYFIGAGYGGRSTTRNNAPANATGSEFLSGNHTFGAFVARNHGRIPLAGTMGVRIGFLSR